MPDTTEVSETAPVLADAALGTPTDAAAPPVAAASQPEPGAADTARLLGERFPALFGAGVIKPIKLRIQADIHERAPGVFTKKALSMFLQRHTTTTAYLRALVAEGATRVDLDGQPVSEVAAEHRDAARQELERRRAIVEAKKLAGREAARAARQEARPSRPPGASDRPARSGQQTPPGQTPRHARPPQPGAQRGRERPGDGGSAAPSRPHKPAPRHNPAEARKHEPASAPASPLTPEEAAQAEARQQRAMLLRSFEQSPLSKANFGALKGLSEAALDELLTLARQERSSRRDR